MGFRENDQVPETSPGASKMMIKKADPPLFKDSLSSKFVVKYSEVRLADGRIIFRMEC